MKSISKIAALLSLAGGLAGAAQAAVQDLPGGPAVRQLNLHSAATRIAAWSTAAVFPSPVGAVRRRCRPWWSASAISSSGTRSS